MLRVLFSISLLMIVSACSGGFGTMDRIMSSWEGAKLDEVIAQWGYPHQEQNIAGHKVYRWFHNKSAFIPSQTHGTVNTIGSTSYINTTTTGGGMISGQCVRTLEVDKKNRVISWEWSGNNCPFAELMEYSDWRKK
jgi:hypothetical protein